MTLENECILIQLFLSFCLSLTDDIGRRAESICKTDQSLSSTIMKLIYSIETSFLSQQIHIRGSQKNHEQNL